jgi:hypothetical protein
VNLFPKLNTHATTLASRDVVLHAPDDDTLKLLLEFKKQEAVSKGDFATPFRQEAQTFPIGQEPLLATAIHFTPTATGMTIAFEEHLENSSSRRAFQMHLNTELLGNFMHLLEQSLRASQWDIGLVRQAHAATVEGPDALPTPPHPRYLN